MNHCRHALRLAAAAGLIGAFVFGPREAHTQAVQPVEQTLAQPVATYGEPFSLISGLRELSDERVLVADGLEETLRVLEPDLSAAQVVGRRGQGPGEHGQPDQLFAWGNGDESLLVDLGNGRLTVVAPDGSLGESTPMSEEVNGSLLVIYPRGVDANRHIYLQPFGGARGQVSDSAAIVRLRADRSGVDTLALVKEPERKRSTSGGANNQFVRIRQVPLSAQDAWAVGSDGSVAIARSGDYHLEWVRPDGRIVSGRPVPYEAVRVRKAEKEDWLASRGNGLRMSVSIDNGRRQTSFSRGGGGNSGPSIDDYEWPEIMPPFTGARAVLVTPDGRAWVRRSVPSSTPQVYDVFGDSGERIGVVAIPEGRVLVGFGAGSVYLFRTDDLDFVWLEKYERQSL